MKFCSVYFWFVIKQDYRKQSNTALALTFGRLKSRAVTIKVSDNTMKKLFFSFLSTILFSLLGLAQAKDKQESAYLKVKSGEETITYEFHSIKDFEENSEKILDEIIPPDKPNKREKKDIFTIEISLTMSLENESTTLTGSITAPDNAIVAEVKKLRSQLIALSM